MFIEFGREICGELSTAETREWLVTNGIGGFASGTVAGLLTRRYHGLLIAALKPPLGRTLLVTKLDETVQYNLHRATRPLQLEIKAFVNYRDYHSTTHGGNWQMKIDQVEHGISVTAYTGAQSFFLLTDKADALPAHDWYYGFDLAVERYRGLDNREDHLHAATFSVTLNPGELLTFVASTGLNPSLNGEEALELRRSYEKKLVSLLNEKHLLSSDVPPQWINQLVLAADQFIVSRPLPNEPGGKTIIAGYHWFGDWGRDTMISLPGLSLSTGRPEIAQSILRHFAKYVDRGMLPNRFPDAGEQPEYNTLDAPLWYFEAS